MAGGAPPPSFLCCCANDWTDVYLHFHHNIIINMVHPTLVTGLDMGTLRVCDTAPELARAEAGMHGHINLAEASK
eukprot:COSAG01_NODE_1812_length_9179_cov_36.648789_10_plen_75_part_00